MIAPPPYPIFTDAAADPVARRRLDDIIRTIWFTRADLRMLAADDPDQFQWWLLIHGAAEYQGLVESPLHVSSAWLREPAPISLAGIRPVLTRFMHFIWSMRPDLQAAFDLAMPIGQQDFVWWYFLQGPVDHQLGRFFTPEQKNFLNQPDEATYEGGSFPLTRIMLRIRQGRPDLRQAFPLSEPGGRLDFLRWYFVNGVVELNLLELVDADQCAMLRNPCPQFPDLPQILWWIWRGDAGLQQRFATAHAPSLLSWARTEGMVQYPILRRVMGPDPIGQMSAPLVQRPTQMARPGVNLIGYATGQFGIGEDVRMAALALRAVGVPFSIHDVPSGPAVAPGAAGEVETNADRLPHNVNLLCMTGMDTARLLVTQGSSMLTNRVTIGYWPWELAMWPDEWQHAYEPVDEIWASSRFIYDAYKRDCPKPVRHMPMAVSVDATDGLQRAHFGLPEQKLLFLFVFDSLSMATRKNPVACVKAFKAAFPTGTEPVGLVVKTMRSTMAAEAWCQVEAAIDGDPRITVIHQTFGRGAILDLFRICDIFISLHRAEGFGRAIAEAMLLGKPVITTGFSGNMDFTVPGTAALVDHRIRPLRDGEYPFGDGQVWAEPDIDHAAWWMRRLATHPQIGQRLARTGQQLVHDAHSPQVVGQHYRAILGRFEI